MPKKEKDSSFKKFLNYIIEHNKDNKSTVSRAIHFTRFYSLVLLSLQCVIVLIMLLLVYNNPVAATTWATPLNIVFICLIFMALDTIFIWYRLKKISNVSHRTEMGVASILGQDVKDAYDFARLGMAVVDENNIVIWVNEFLSSRQINLLDVNIYQRFENLVGIKEDQTINIKVNNVIYAVEYIKDSRFFLFKDVTDYEEEHDNALKEAIVIGKLVIDTYDEISKSVDSKKFIEMVQHTQSTIDNYFSSVGAVCLQNNEDDNFTILCNYESFCKMRDGNFSILENIRENSRGDDAMMMTISIGFAHGFNESISSLFTKAMRACATALKRGGDQIIVADGEGQTVYGGTNKVHRQQNLVKYRTYAQALSMNVRDSSKVIIAGHKISDMDSLGASLGFYSFCRTVKKNNGEQVPAYVVFDVSSSQSNALNVVQSMKKQGFKSIFISPSDVEDIIDEKTLVILSDVHNPVGSLISKNFDTNSKDEVPARIVIFDHHMKNTSDIDLNPLLECIDPSISSASEMVTHLLQYAEEDPHLPATISDVLLSGIMLDTSFFKNRVDSSTYHACNLLVQQGARSENASNLLKEAYETYQLKCSIGSSTNTNQMSDNFFLRNGLHIFIVCAVDPKNANASLDKDILAKVADEHVATKDVDACFVIGKVADGFVYVSCRGNGKYNVQRVAESFKDGFGGGEFDRAAVQFQVKTETLHDIKEKIKEKILELADMSEQDY